MTTTTSSHEPSGRQLRNAGYDDVIAADESLTRGAREHIERALDELIELGLPFTSDDIHALLPEDCEPHSPNLIPALIGSWRCLGKITPVGWTTSTRPSRHAAAVRVWVAAPAEAGEAA